MKKQGTSFTIDVTKTPTSDKPPASSQRKGSLHPRRGGGSREKVIDPDEEFRKQAAAVLGDPELLTASEGVIRKIAKERIEGIKAELEDGAIGPTGLDKQFGPVWVSPHRAR